MSAAYKRSAEDRLALRAAMESRELLVIGLCAAWCDTCGEFLEAFERVALETPHGTFLWLDIEDDADLVGDVDVENFPTLAIFDRARSIHFGVSLPQEGNLRRLLGAMGRQTETTEVVAPIADLPGAIRRWALAD